MTLEAASEFANCFAICVCVHRVPQDTIKEGTLLISMKFYINILKRSQNNVARWHGTSHQVSIVYKMNNFTLIQQINRLSEALLLEAGAAYTSHPSPHFPSGDTLFRLECFICWSTQYTIGYVNKYTLLFRIQNNLKPELANQAALKDHSCVTVVTRNVSPCV